MSHSKHKDHAEKFLIDVYQNGNIELLDTIMHPEYGPHEALEFLTQFEDLDLGPGIDPLKERIQGIRDGASNLQFKIIEIIAETNNVIVFYQLSGVHSGAYLGIPPTGKPFEVTGFHLFRFKDGLIHRIATLQDHYKILRDVGRAVLDADDEREVSIYLEALKKLRIAK